MMAPTSTSFPRAPMAGLQGPAAVWTLAWLVLVAGAATLRPPMPMDETRYLAVAWEMWTRGDFLVPHLNGAPYSHKPPLLFWLMQAGWGLFGVNDVWPRLVAPLFGLINLFLTARLGRRLWPETEVASLAPLLLVGSLYWAVFTTLTMFDMILAACALVGLNGLLAAWRGARLWGWLWFGLGVGVGVLAKGPAILLHMLPVALLAPWWDREKRIAVQPGGWRAWYLSLLAAVLLGAAIGLAWAIPAALSGGDEYAHAIFWGQSANRMVNASDHQRGWWWFLAVTPVLLLPWTVWPAALGSLARLGRVGRDLGGRFCLAWFAPAFVAFSLISGKQPHYLLPDFPAFAMILAWLLLQRDGGYGRSRLVPAGFVAVIGLALVLAPLVAGGRLPGEVDAVAGLWGLLPMGVAGLVALESLSRERAAVPAVGGMALMVVALVVAVHLIARPYLADAYDLRAVARELGRWQADGRPLAHYGKYHGQFQFLGRLREPVDEIGDGDAAEWLAAHPRGLVVTYAREPAEGPAEPAWQQAFRGRILLVWDAETAIVDPDILKLP